MVEGSGFVRLIGRLGYNILISVTLVASPCFGQNALLALQGIPPSGAVEVENAIDKSLIYVKGQHISRPDILFFLADLNTYYSLGIESIPIDSLLSVKGHRLFCLHNGHDYFKNIPDSALTEARKALSDIEYFTSSKTKRQIEWLNTLSLFCDSLDLDPALLLQQIRNEYRTGKPYFVLHALLHLHVSTIKGCIAPSTLKDTLCKEARILFDQYSSEDFVGSLNNIDIANESVAFSLFCECNSVEWHQIQWVMDNQREDGSWVASSKYPDANHHSSVLGMWALLQLKNNL